MTPDPRSLVVMLLEDWQRHSHDVSRLTAASTAKNPASTHEVIQATAMAKASKQALARTVHAFTNAYGGGYDRATNWTYGEDLADIFAREYAIKLALDRAPSAA